MSSPQSLHQLFYTEPGGRFAFGRVLRSAAARWNAGEIVADDETGLWHCDLTDGNRLTWSETVYELFGLPVGEIVPREIAVARYSDQSKIALKRVRDFAIRSGCGFILDAAINPDGSNRWIRILAIPIVEDGRVIGLHGLKRALQPSGGRRSKKAAKPELKQFNAA